MKKLSSTELLVYFYIYNFKNNKEGCFASNKTIGEITFKSERVISRAIAELIKQEYIKNTGTITRRNLFPLKDISRINIYSEKKKDLDKNDEVKTSDLDKFVYAMIKHIDENLQCTTTRLSMHLDEIVYDPRQKCLHILNIFISYLNSNLKNNNSSNKKSNPKPKIDNQKDFDLIFEDAIKTIPTLQKENWEAFIEMRKAIKKPLTSFGARGLKNKLIDFAKLGSDPNDVLSYSIINSYPGIYEVKEKKQVKVIKPWWEDFQPTFMGWDRFVLNQVMPENITAEEKKTIEKWIEKAKAENIITLEREAHIKRMREAEEEKKKKQQEIDDYYKKHPPREWPKPEKKPIVEIPPEEKEFSDELKKMIENL